MQGCSNKVFRSGVGVGDRGPHMAHGTEKERRRVGFGG